MSRRALPVYSNMRTVLLTLMLLTMPIVAEAQWAYIAPPWNFDHPRYSGREVQAIPLGEWEQLAAFDSAAKCENGRLFAREIRDLSPLDREQLLALFASGAEKQARVEAELRLAKREASWRHLKEVDKNVADLEEIESRSARMMLGWWSASKCVRVGSLRPR
jgi:hypothetical protein